MRDFNEPLETIKKFVDEDIKDLKENGDSDASLNYLYFLRDELNKKIKQERKEQRAKNS